MTWKNPFPAWKSFRRERSEVVLPQRAVTGRRVASRRSIFETMEPRLMFDAAPIWVGGVYVEADQGSDQHGDSFYISFNGGAENTQLTRLVINTDQNASGIGVADNIFDVTDGGLGADHAFPFQIEQLIARDPRAKVTVSVADSSMQMILTFENFYAGDRLIFSIDVDEVQHYDPAERDLSEINSGLDPITSGVEFQGSKFQASFTAPHFQDIDGQSIFQNRYDTILAPTNLTLPADNEGGLRDRSAGTAFSVVQVPKPISIAGTVYVDNNVNLKQDVGELGLQGVALELFRKEGNQYITTGHRATTDLQGRYRFGLDLNLQPGTYQVRETQPNGYFSVGAIPGLLDGRDRVGQTVSNNKDFLTEILIPFGDQHATQLDFAEAQPASVRGFVYEDLNDNGRRDTGEMGLGGVEIQLVAIDAIASVPAQTIRTNSDGSYSFNNLPPGRYKIVEATQPVDYFDGQDTPGTVGGTTRGTLNINDAITDIVLNGNESGIEFNFGELPPSTLSGHVFEDKNNDGIRQTDEPMIAGATVSLFDSRGNPVGQLQSDASGFYKFSFLRAGTYRLVETTPAGFIDGKDRAGTIQGVPVGNVDQSLDTIADIVLPAGRQGIDYDFGEIRPSSIAGQVIVDTDGNCIIDVEGDRPLPGVTVELLDSRGAVLQTTRTAENGSYRFVGLRPGTYAVREHQPDGYFDGDHKAGSGGGDVSMNDEISKILMRGGQSLVNYNFCEVPPAVISGYVFQDGPVLVTQDGKIPDRLRPLRDGVRDESDTPLAGVVMELRTILGQPFPSERAMPGVYTGPSITVTTDADGYFEFAGLRPGSYHIYQRQPTGYIDGLDTAGTTGGISINTEDIIDDFATLSLLEALTQDESTNPRNDAILRVTILAGEFSRENNFSEIRIESEPNPVPPFGAPPAPFNPPPQNGFPRLPFDRMLVGLPPTPYTPPLLIAGGASVEYTWHLSIINSGMPRGALSGKQVSRNRLAQAASVLNVSTWTIEEVDAAQWTFVATEQNKLRSVRRQSFDIDGALTLAGDFNGDGQDELALFLEGEWLIDINGNGRWDRGDMWAKLGDEDDLPVIGDWDGDGKDDIGVFGPEWEGDERALEREPGLPDPENHRLAKPKNVPPNPDETPEQERLLQRSANGPARADVIDHVFRLGVKDDQPIAGDFNGDGITSIGLFSGGRWRLDVNGDGLWTEDIDKTFEFGQAGDIAVVGDFDGDGIDEVAVIRGNRLIIDSNRNERLDATDRVFELEGSDGDVVVGDFDGDGKDEAALIKRSESFKTRGRDGVMREARKAS